jgi:hypothetical protein
MQSNVDSIVYPIHFEVVLDFIFNVFRSEV